MTSLYSLAYALMEYQPWMIQSGRWCAQSLFENFTLQRLAALIRAELRWTIAPCQWITHFTAGNRHDTVQILAMQGALDGLPAPRAQYETNYAVRGTLIGPMQLCVTWRPCALKIQRQPPRNQTKRSYHVSAPEVLRKNPFRTGKGATNVGWQGSYSHLTRAHQHSTAPTQQHFTGGLLLGLMRANCTEQPCSSPSLPPSPLSSLSPSPSLSLWTWRAKQVISLHRSVKVSRV